MPQSGLTHNVFVYDANVPEDTEAILVGGMLQFGHTTGAEFYFCVEVCSREREPSTFQLLATDAILLPRDGTLVRTGSYTVVSTGISPPTGFNVLANPPKYVSVTLTEEAACPRTISGGSPGTFGVCIFPYCR